ncbi:MAG: peptide chain release factor N(5)-glutamine methyltransferase [Actinomycetota bacterium]
MFQVRTLMVRDALKLVASRLKKHGVEGARLEAELLLQHILNLSRADLYLYSDRFLTTWEKAFLREAIQHRIQGMPIQYIIGWQAFRHLNLRVRPGVFIPRPETELLVEQVIDVAKSMVKPLTIVDVGTGSGAIALTIAHEVPQARVHALDISERALKLAEENARLHNLEDKIIFVRSELFENLDPNLLEEVDIIVSNPPYIREKEIEKLPKEIRDFEPRPALSGGIDGLKIHKRIIADSPRYLREGGFLALEVGFDQAQKVSEILHGSGNFEDIRVLRDYSGMDRVVSAVKRSRAFIKGHN